MRRGGAEPGAGANDLLRARKASGQAFTRAHIRATDFTLYRDTPAGHLDSQFDHFVAGSDQVWNPELPQAFGGRFPDLRRAGEADRLLG